MSIQSNLFCFSFYFIIIIIEDHAKRSDMHSVRRRRTYIYIDWHNAPIMFKYLFNSIKGIMCIRVEKNRI